MNDKEFTLAREQYEQYKKVLRYMWAHFGGHFTDVDYWEDSDCAVSRPGLWRAIWNVVKHWWRWHRELNDELTEGERILEEKE